MRSSANKLSQASTSKNVDINEPSCLSAYVQRKLTIGSPDDPLEKEADGMADKVMRMEMPQPINFSSAKNSINRKCAHCEEEEKQLQKKHSGGDHVVNAPSIVHDVINSPAGRSMDANIRSFMESRFNYDFSNVKIHDNSIAAKSADSINALAYTSGNNIVFNSGQYRTNSDSGKRLLAHELTHVVQQKKGVSTKQIQRQRASATVTSTPPPRRGPNPSSCLTPLCSQLETPSTACLNNPHQCAQTWITDVIACLNTGAGASNASHANEIISNTQQELTDQITYINRLQPLASSTDKRNYFDWLSRFCRAKQRELFIEFNYNVVFDNVPTTTAGSQLTPWGYNASDWDEIEVALAAIPDEHLWGRSSTEPIVHFRRELMHPSGTAIGGETDPNTGTISIYNAGVGAAPMGRSASIGVSATNQTIRHEVGHLVERNLSSQLISFFDSVIGWHYHPISFLLTNPPANDTHRTFQMELCNELQFVNSSGECDRARLIAFINGVPLNGNVILNNRIYTRTSGLFMSWPIGSVPTGPEFSYARTSPSDYFAEVYSLSLSNPDFIYRSLPPNQIEWLKQNVFNTRAIYDELITPYRNLAANGDQVMLNRYQSLLQSAETKFTRQQLEPISQQLQLLLLQITNRTAGAAVA
jgi:hypothetical protein